MNQADLQAIADLTASGMNCPCQVKVEWKRGALHSGAGRAMFRTGHISIPRWASTKGEEYLTYYVVHETAHIITRNIYGRTKPHGQLFKSVEAQALALWGITLKFATTRNSYPDTLYCNGQTFNVK